MLIRQMQRDDLPAVQKLKDAEGWNQTAEDLGFILVQNPKNCLVATIENQVVGSVTTQIYQNTLAWIGMMLVQKGLRGRGIATQLLDRAIKAAKECASIKLDATPKGIPVYRHLGFMPEYELCRMAIQNAPLPVEKLTADHSIETISSTNLSSMVSHDRARFGAERGSVLAHLLSQSEHAFLLRKCAVIGGYIFTRPGTRFLQVGPLNADSTMVAKILLGEVFSRVKSQPLVLDILSDKIELISWLKGLGFQDERKLLRMYLNNNCTGEIQNQYLIAGPELG